MGVTVLKEIKSETLYKTVVNNAQRIGGKYFALVPRELLIVDESYQRTKGRSKNKINALVRNWDDSKMAPLKCTAHAEEGKICVVDGYGRMIASSMLATPKEELECEIIFDVPDDVDERRKYEAYLFASQTDEVEPIRLAQRHNANLILGEKTAVALQEVLDKYDVKIAYNTGKRRPGVLGSYSDTYKIVKGIGKDGLDFIFGVIKELSWNEEANGYSSCVVAGLRKVYEAEDKTKTRTKAIAILRETTPELFRATAISRYPKRSEFTAARMYMEDLLNGRG